MFAEAMPERVYHTYRARMETFLQIPIDASDQDFHEQIHRGFPASAVQALLNLGAIDTSTRNQIVPLTTLRRRLAQGERLTMVESDRLFRVIHITAMAQALFEDTEKAKRWLTKPKVSLSGISPIAMHSTTLGTCQVEEMLVRLGEGFAF
jgi:putative toxin-antitoxin system antitoxin component (TIGR02293 family)